MDKLEALLRRLSSRERALLVMIVASLAIVAAKFFVADELLAALEARRSALAIEAEVERSRNMLTDLSTRRPASFTASPLYAYRKENSGLGNLIRKVSAGAEVGRDFTVRKISLEKAESLPEFEKNRFELEVEGPFHSIGNFLQELESSRFLTRVESVQVFRIEKELRLCRARILVSSFSWREP